MKKVSSVVWKFFDRIEENKRCVAVLCKLCDSQYKYFGNTTNLRVHLINKHPIQWELSENGTLDESNFTIVNEAVGDTPNKSTPTKRRKYKARGSNSKNVRYFVSVNNEDDGIVPKIEVQRTNENSDTDPEDDTATLNLVRQMHGEQQSDEEWLDDDPYQITHIETYEPKVKQKRKYRKIKREVTSPTDLPGFYMEPKRDKIIYEENNSKDEYSVFAEYVANKLRKIKAPRTRGNLQQLITTILWQAEYGMYDNADTVRRVLMMNVQTEPDHIIEFDSNHTVQTEEVIEHHSDNGELDPYNEEKVVVIN